jgi:hypothetical protein
MMEKKQRVIVITVCAVSAIALGLGLGLGLGLKSSSSSSAVSLASALAASSYTPVAPLPTPGATSKRRRSLLTTLSDVSNNEVIEDPVADVMNFPNNILCALIEKSGLFSSDALDGWTTTGETAKTIKSSYSVTSCPYEDHDAPDQSVVAQVSYVQGAVASAGTTTYDFSAKIWLQRKGNNNLNTINVECTLTMQAFYRADGSMYPISIDLEFDSSDTDSTSGVTAPETHTGYIKQTITYDSTNLDSASVSTKTTSYLHNWQFGGLTGMSDYATIVEDESASTLQSKGNYYTGDINVVGGGGGVVTSAFTVDLAGGYARVEEVYTDSTSVTESPTAACMDMSSYEVTGYAYKLFDTDDGEEYSTGTQLYSMTLGSWTSTTSLDGTTVLSAAPSPLTFDSSNRYYGSGMTFYCQDLRTRAVAVSTSGSCTVSAGYDAEYLHGFLIPTPNTVTLTATGLTTLTKTLQSVAKKIVYTPAASSSSCSALTANTIAAPLISAWTDPALGTAPTTFDITMDST